MSKYDFESAMAHFEVAGNHELFSQAFWELRNDWLQKYLKYILIAAAIAYAAAVIVGRVDKEERIKSEKARIKQKIVSLKGVGDTLYGFQTARHPLDGFYDIRIQKKGTVLGASILYGLLFISFMLFMLGKGFIYQYYDVQDLDIGSIVVGFFAFIGLFVVCNYLVTSINDGEGSLKQVFMTVAYAAVPLILALLSITVLSYFVTTNEAFFLDVIMLIGAAWTAVLLFLGLQTVHNYTVKETIKGILLTALFMFVVVIVVLIVTIMWEQVWKFLSTIGKELVQNVL